tara:strand:- start:8597 stop:8797 length:201 start_codon:yes stop_codon:yes gene_type:complete
MASSLTPAITNPLHHSVMQAVIGGGVMLGHDPNCSKGGIKFHEPVAEGESIVNRRERLRKRFKITD